MEVPATEMIIYPFKIMWSSLEQVIHITIRVNREQRVHSMDLPHASPRWTLVSISKYVLKKSILIQEKS